MKAAYLLIDAGSLAFPLAFSRSRRFGFGPSASPAWAAVALSAIPFAAWDIAFARAGVWDFNPRYVLGPSLLGLPCEEWLFFLAIPFACLFLYRQFAGPPGTARPAPRAGRAFATGMGLAALGGIAFALASAPRAYSVAAGLAAAAAAAALAFARPRYAAPFLKGLSVQYVPFLIVNGLLTALPVVRYRAEAILGFRIGTIPVEDALYCFVLFALPVALYEALTRRAGGGVPAGAGSPTGGRQRAPSAEAIGTPIRAVPRGDSG